MKGLQLRDSVPIDFAGVSYILHSIADGNANCLVLDFPVGGAVDVPVFIAALSNTDFGYFNGQTQPALAAEDVAGTGAIYISHSGALAGTLALKGTTVTLNIVGVTTNIAASTLATILGAGR